MLTPSNCEESLKVVSALEFSTSTSMEQARRSDTIAVAHLVKDGNKEQCYLFISAIIVFLNQYHGTTWTDFQVRESAKQLYHNYYFFRLADWKLFQVRVIGGMYGKIYGDWKPQMLMEFAAQYADEWFALSEQQTLQEHDSIRKNERGLQTDAQRERDIAQSWSDIYKKTHPNEETYQKRQSNEDLPPA